MRRAAAWIGVAALIVLAARSLAYALSPSPLAADLSHRAGGPALPVVTVVSLVLAVAAAAAVVWLAALGVRERGLLEQREVTFEPRLRVRRICVHAGALWVATLPVFALLESYLHWRAGLGWHGLRCLVGPVHRDAIPLLAALSLVASAVVAAIEHVLAWMRRTLAMLAPRIRLVRLDSAARPPLGFVPLPAFATTPVARGPPRRS